MATLKDIAKEVGISVTAASLALRDHPSISIETKRRVWQSQDRLGYHRHPKPKRMRATPKKSRTRATQIAFLLVDRTFQDLAYSECFGAVAAAASRRNLLPVFLSAKSEDLRAGILPISLKNREVDGVIVSGIYDAQEHRSLIQANIPIVVIGNYDLGATPWAACEIDNRLGICLMIDRLHALGHTRLGLVDAGAAQVTHQEVQSTFLNCILKKNLVNAGITTLNSSADLKASLRESLKKSDRPTALLLGLSGEAKQTYEVCHELGLKIPDDISLISYGADQHVSKPKMASVQVNLEELANGAVEKLLRMIEDPRHPITREIFGMALRPGGSIGKCSVNSSSASFAAEGISRDSLKARLKNNSKTAHNTLETGPKAN